MSAQLKAANDWRRIRKQCMPLFETALKFEPKERSAVYKSMVGLIAGVLDAPVSAHDLDVSAGPSLAEAHADFVRRTGRTELNVKWEVLAA